MKNVYFIGIGGIGMSAIARYYNHAGYNVSGYDKTPSKITAALEEEGISVHYTDDISFVPEDVNETLVIYTPAIPKDMGELVYVMEKGYRTVKRSLALGEIASTQQCLAIAGTHGKTTTSTLLAHIYTHSGEGCSAFLGGISKNYHTNLLLSNNKVIVAEADEFDRSFLQLYPEIAVITSTDADHLDIYGDTDTIRAAFAEFAGQIKPSGYLIMKKGISLALEDVKAKVFTYSFTESADFYPSEVEILQGGYFKFNLNYPQFKIAGSNETVAAGTIEGCLMGVPGWINAENAVAAAASALLGGISPEKIREALAAFSGVERRMDIHVNRPECAYIDDYAHHPKELSSAIGSIRNIFPGRKVCAIFQPHLYTRTRDFANDFAQSLSMLDQLILLEIYPARELPIEGVTSKIIFDNVTISDKIMIKKENLMEYLENKKDIDILVTFGAGDIDRLIVPIKEMLEKRMNTKG
ncbi:MAG: UDP-N-acetylmuramate--L-alanine ligase [Bacteroidales bacterium]|nr:UDP-N-acetylmuramate--L-alanine ligase [Bacteroidales bacterium]